MLQCFVNNSMTSSNIVNVAELDTYHYHVNAVTINEKKCGMDGIMNGYPDTMGESTDDRDTYVIIAVTLVGFLIIVSCIGNLVVLLAIRKVKKLQTVSNAFVFNLSLCDLLSAGCVLPFTIYTYITDGWDISGRLCNFVGFLGYTLTGTTIITITLIAYNRYKLVLDVGTYKQLYTKRNIAVMIMFAWTIPIICLIPAVVGIWGQFGYVPMMVTCNLTLDHKSQLFKIFLMVFRAGIPCGLIVYYYTRIYFTTMSSHRRLSVSRRTLSALDLHNQRKEMRMTRMMVIIFLVFALSYFPCTITGLIDWTSIMSKKYHMFCQISVYIASGANPLIYGLMNSHFRQAYREIICCVNLPQFRYRYIRNITRESNCSVADFNETCITPRMKGKPKKSINKKEKCTDKMEKKVRPTFTL